LEELIYAESPLRQDEAEKVIIRKPAQPEKSEVSIQVEEPRVQQKEQVEEIVEEPGKEPVQEEPVLMPEGLTPELQEYFKQLDGMTVHELRRLARTVEGLSIFGRQISRANKKELMVELLNVKKG
jgi:hypothetical protein